MTFGSLRFQLGNRFQSDLKFLYQLLFSCDKTKLQPLIPEEDEEETGSDGEPSYC